MMLQVLHVPNCPNTAVLSARLTQALTGCRAVVLEHRVIRDQREAAAWGMTGSPTLLVDGIDPFPTPGLAPSMSCRLYRDQAGVVSGAPSVAQLRAVLACEPGANDDQR